MDSHPPPAGEGPRWQAPTAAGPVRASLRLPGSKSMTNRALVLAALADGPGAVTRPLRARTSARLVMDFEPGSVRLARTGPAAAGACQRGPSPAGCGCESMLRA